MQSLFDKFKPRGASFLPRTLSDLFALRLAQKLGDTAAVHHYVQLADRYSEEQLICAYKRARRSVAKADLSRRFHVELDRLPRNGNHNGYIKLVSIRIERRAVAAAIFDGDHLSYTDSRQLSSAHDKALSSAVGFIGWMLGRFPVESATLETIPEGQEVHRRVLHDAICEGLRSRMLPIWEIPRAAVLEGCGHPALKSRAQLREIASSIWPILAGTNAKSFIQDAAILGLHAQTERLFIIN